MFLSREVVVFNILGAEGYWHSNGESEASLCRRDGCAVSVALTPGGDGAPGLT